MMDNVSRGLQADRVGCLREARYRRRSVPWWLPGLAAVALVARPGGVLAQCGVNGDFTGPCVNLEWRPAQVNAFLGETVELGLYAVSVNAFSQQVQSVQAVLDWDPAAVILEGNKVCSGGTRDGLSCVRFSDCPPQGVGACVDVCTANDTAVPCFNCPAVAPDPASYNWVSSGFPFDEELDGLNDDCGDGVFCQPYSGTPFNDGDALFQAIKQVFCNGLAAPAPLVGPDGLLVTKIRFTVNALGTTSVSIVDRAACQNREKRCVRGDFGNDLPLCVDDTDCRQRICNGGLNNGLNCASDANCPGGTCPVRGRECQGGASPGTPCTSDFDCPNAPGSQGTCPVLCAGCLAENCCTTDEVCTLCAFAETRVVGGPFGTDITATIGPPAVINTTNCLPPQIKAVGPKYFEVIPAAGPDPVALRIRGVDADVSCALGYVSSSGLMQASPTYRTPAAWGVVSVRGLDMVSSRTYTVEADCDPANPGSSVSDPVSATLWLWGDTDNNGVVDVLDITRGVDMFRGRTRTPFVNCLTDADCISVLPNQQCDTAVGGCLQIRPGNVDLVGAIQRCIPDQDVSILDITTIVDAFRRPTVPCLGSCVP